MKEEARQLLASLGGALLPMADDYFTRGDLLERRGWHAFRPPLEGLHEFGSEEEVAEYKHYRLDYARRSVGRGAYKSRYFDDLRRKAFEAYARSKDYVDQSFPALCRSVELLARDNKAVYEEKIARIRAAIEKARQEEIAEHCKGYYKEVDESRFEDRRVLYRRVLEGELAELGFVQDKSLSTRNKPIYAKPLLDDWKIGFTLEWQNFSNGYLKENDPTGGSLEMYFGLVQESNRGFVLGDYTKAVVYQFGYFFPTCVGCSISGDVYQEFRRYRELEVILLAHVDMYKIVQEPFEDLAREGLMRWKQWVSGGAAGEGAQASEAAGDGMLSESGKADSESTAALDIPMDDTVIGLLFPIDAKVLADTLESEAEISEVDTLDDRWHVAQLEERAMPDLSHLPELPGLGEKLSGWSRQAPIMLFVHAGDFGWAYILYADGEQVAMFSVGYGPPEETGFTTIIDQAHPESFERLGLGSDKVRRLQVLFEPKRMEEAIQKQEGWKLANRFRDILDIFDMPEIE